jgi:pimeloyl-ACP methyl ester carboxylesterase
VSAVQTVKTSKLEISFTEAGPSNGPVLLLLHGWPDDATTWDEVSPQLNAAGLRTLAPMLRGFGSTQFLPPSTQRSGNTAILALDALEMLDALAIEHCWVAGHDWGSNIAEMLAVGWPERIGRIAMLSTPSRLGGLKTSPFWHARLQWYHWFQATKRGADAVRRDPKGFARIMWETWSPMGWFEDATFERVAQSFANPDWVDITLHSYQSRWDEAMPDPDSKWLDDKVKATPTLGIPSIYIQGEHDGVNPPATTESMADKYIGDFRRVVLDGVGHFPTREAPEQVASLLVDHFK